MERRSLEARVETGRPARGLPCSMGKILVTCTIAVILGRQKKKKAGWGEKDLDMFGRESCIPDLA